MSKFDEFVKALDALCKEHDVRLSTTAYDFLQVWDGDCTDGAGTDPERIDDRTGHHANDPSWL